MFEIGDNFIKYNKDRNFYLCKFKDTETLNFIKTNKYNIDISEPVHFYEPKIIKFIFETGRTIECKFEYTLNVYTEKEDKQYIAVPKEILPITIKFIYNNAVEITGEKIEHFQTGNRFYIGMENDSFVIRYQNITYKLHKKEDYIFFPTLHKIDISYDDDYLLIIFPKENFVSVGFLMLKL